MGNANQWRKPVMLTYQNSWSSFLRHGSIIQRRRLFDMTSNGDTVYALSSGQGKCGVAVVRVSGPKASEALVQLGQFKLLPQPRLATLRKLINPQSGEMIDHGLIVWFPGPGSFTGEDSVEFHLHGGTAVVLAMLDSLKAIPGFRHAEPGDFTKRAFINGKLDLTEVEGLADLIHAETESQRRQALRQMEGDLSKLYNTWSEKLLKCVAHIEATIDFGEDENIEEGLVDEVKDKVKHLVKEITDHLNDGRRGERLRSGIHVAIIGAPNAGKSTLLNILCQRPAAIVSPCAGTTRDVIESLLDLFGYPIILSDTAGLRSVSDLVESEGIRRALQKAENADLKILIVDSSLFETELNSPHFFKQPFHQLTRHFLGNFINKEWLQTNLSVEDTIIIMNKTDLLCTYTEPSKIVEDVPICWVSCTTRTGMESFLQVLKCHLEKLGGNPLAGNPSLTQTRHRHHLQQCNESLNNFLKCCSMGDGDLVLAAEELRLALRQLGRITGRIGIEEVLDVIFRDFCIGK